MRRSVGFGGRLLLVAALLVNGVYQGKVAYAVVGDAGPSGAIGEGSYKLAQLLGINPNPATGGVSGAVVTYILFPGVSASPIESASDAVTKGEAAANGLVSGVQTCANTSVEFTSCPTLQAGSTGGAVMAAQCLLGMAEPPTGSFDAATTDAAKAFQSRVGLPDNSAARCRRHRRNRDVDRASSR